MGRDPKAKLSYITVHLIHAEFSIHHRPNPISLFRESPPTGFEYGTGKDEVSVFVKFVDVGIRRKRQGMNGPQIDQFLGWNPNLKELPIVFIILDFQDKLRLAETNLSPPKKEKDNQCRPPEFSHQEASSRPLSPISLPRPGGKRNGVRGINL
jgi:hypothetical protein